MNDKFKCDFEKERSNDNIVLDDLESKEELEGRASTLVKKEASDLAKEVVNDLSLELQDRSNQLDSKEDAKLSKKNLKKTSFNSKGLRDPRLFFEELENLNFGQVDIISGENIFLRTPKFYGKMDSSPILEEEFSLFLEKVIWNEDLAVLSIASISITSIFLSRYSLR